MTLLSKLFVAAAALAPIGAAHAQSTSIVLGPSVESYVLYGQGQYGSSGLGTFTNQQGAEVYNAMSNTTTDTLTGAITSSPFGAGTYSFITSYTGKGVGLGGTELTSRSLANNLAFFTYTSADPSLTMTLFLNTLSGSYTVPVLANVSFLVDNLSFTFTAATCTGVATCTQNNVGLTPGATQFGPVTTTVTLLDTAPPPAPVAAVPEIETWAMMVAGLGLVGAALRGRRRTTVQFA